MNKIALGLTLTLSLFSSANAAVMTYDSQSAFDGATTNIVHEGFTSLDNNIYGAGSQTFSLADFDLTITSSDSIYTGNTFNFGASSDGDGELVGGWDPVSFSFVFDQEITAFGSYWVDMDGFFDVTYTLSDSTSATVTGLSGSNGTSSFFGLTSDIGFTSITLFSDDGAAVGMDDAQYQFASVPEPSSLALLGLSLAGLGFSRRKKSS